MSISPFATCIFGVQAWYWAWRGHVGVWVRRQTVQPASTLVCHGDTFPHSGHFCCNPYKYESPGVTVRAELVMLWYRNVVTPTEYWMSRARSGYHNHTRTSRTEPPIIFATAWSLVSGQFIRFIDILSFLRPMAWWCLNHLFITNKLMNLMIFRMPLNDD